VQILGLRSSSNIIRAIKSKGTRLAGHVDYMGEITNAYKMVTGNPEGKRTLE
jgi:hypothetical protein